jgi:hypothetical protein
LARHTTEADAIVVPINPAAMPVILRSLANAIAKALSETLGLSVVWKFDLESSGA